MMGSMTGHLIPTPMAHSWETWQERQARLRAQASTPDALAALAERVMQAVSEAGADAVAITGAQPFPEVKQAIEARKAAGYHATMSFTFKRPERSTDPGLIVAGAQSLVVAARSYRRVLPTESTENTESTESVGEPVPGRVAQYQWTDHYEVLKTALSAGAAVLRAQGWKARVVVDDNALVDRAAAHRAGLGWWGKNANLLLPGRGSWFVLGSLVTDAPLPHTSEAPVADGCGPCNRCIPACPTAAIVSPGVIDARRCLAWIVQAPGDIAMEFRVAMGDRIYGCDDCQDVCPVNKAADRVFTPPEAEAEACAWVPLVELAMATSAHITARYGRWYIPGRDTDALRRNALVALGNVGDPATAEVRQAVQVCLVDPNPMVRRHAAWAAGRLGLDSALAAALGNELDPSVQVEITAAQASIATSIQ